MAQFIIRVAKKESIWKDYSANTITFSCPANWYDYAIRYKDFKVGDQLECVYAHIPLGDSRLNEIDCFGNPMGNNLTGLIDDRDNSIFLRHEPVLLTPAYCFYQENIEKEDIIKNNGLRFDLSSYCEEMGYKLAEVYFLIILDAKGFENDIKLNISKAIKEYSERLIADGSGGYIQSFNESNPISFNLINYDKHKHGEIFYDKNSRREEMWWKFPEYRRQQEGRIVVNSVHFKQRYSDNKEYNWKNNLLRVSLSNLKSYSCVVDGLKNNFLYFTLDKDDNIKIHANFIDT